MPYYKAGLSDMWLIFLMNIYYAMSFTYWYTEQIIGSLCLP